MDYQEPVSKDIKIAQKIVIIHPEDKTKFLLLKRTKQNSLQIVYDLPGGNLAKGELHEESLRREIMEETGLEVSEIYPNEIQSRIQPGGVLFLYIGYVALAKTTDVTLANDEDSSDFIWISPEDFEKEAGNHIILNQARKAVRRTMSKNDEQSVISSETSLKAILLGTTCSGKTSVGKILAEKYNLPVIEVDWEAQKVDPDIFRKYDEDFIDKTFEEINARVLKMDKVMFITSFLEPDRVEEFYKSGFKIIQLYANLDELIKRRTARHNGILSDKRLQNTSKNYHYHMKIANNKSEFLEASIDTSNMSIEETVERVYRLLSNH